MAGYTDIVIIFMKKNINVDFAVSTWFDHCREDHAETKGISVTAESQEDPDVLKSR